jgi:hypothetical protein
MIPRTVGAFIVGKVKDEIFATPEEAQEAVEAIEEQIIANDDHIGTVYRDADGNEIGQAVRMMNVAVYVVSNERSDPEKDLLAAMRNPESEVVFHTSGGQVTRIVYIPPKRPNHEATAQNVKGFRASDI